MKSRLLLTGLAAVALTACGGGGDSAPATPVVTTKVSGTAATGAAMANVTVTAKCASGSGSAVTAADGTFAINIDNARRPCVLSATAADGTVLHSVVEAGSETSVTANVSPFTELVTAALAKGSTDSFFTQFDANAQARLTAANLSTSVETVRLALTGLVDISGVDPLKGALVAANGGKAGNAMDQLLDKLAARLATSKATVADLSTAIGSNAGPEAIGTILKTASATCAGLRTGDYMLVGPGIPGLATIDATALTLTPKSFLGNTMAAPFSASVSSVPLIAGADACRFDSAVMSNTSLLVSKSGVTVLMPSAGTTAAPNGLAAFLVPLQQLPMADLAGDWNAVAFQSADAGTTFVPTRLTFTLDANGKMTAAAQCNDSNACTAWPASDLITLTKNADGSFMANDGTAALVGYGAAFKSTDSTVSAWIATPIGMIAASKAVARALPAVGSTNAYWQYTMFGDKSSDFSKWSTKTISVDATTGSVTRTRIEDNRVDVFKQNVPANGLRYRARSSAAAELIAMNFGNTGVGVDFGLNVSKPFLDISVNRP